MTDHDSRRPLVRYAIAADLAVVATGIALIDPAQPMFLLSVYVVAVAIAAWRGGWRAAALTIVVSAVAQLLLFRASFDESHLVGFIAASAVVTVIVESVSSRHVKPAKAPEQPREYGRFFVVEPDRQVSPNEPADRHEVQRQLERAAARQLAEQREAARRAAEDNKVTPITGKPGTKRDGSKRG